MSRPLSLFADYRAKENLTTNHCGLILKLLYQDNPVAFSKLLSAITGESVQIGVEFAQQKAGPQSVPDLIIRQDAVQIIFEAKNYDWFYSEQLRKHLEAFRPGSGSRVLLAISNFEHESYQEEFEEKHAAVIAEAHEKGITVAAVTFKELLSNLEDATTSPAFKEYLVDFARYLEGNGFLPQWEETLTVVNCGQFLSEFQRGGYFCPYGPSAYSHRRAKYLGAYQGKRVRLIAEVKAVLRLEGGGASSEVLANNGKESAESLGAEAIALLGRMDQWRQDLALKSPVQVFVLKDLHETDFVKDTAGGMQSSRQYFHGIVKKISASNAAELAGKLRGKKWSQFPNE